MLVVVSLLCLHGLTTLPCCGAFTSYLFGDSLVDAGNNDYLFTLSKADSPPYGIDFAPSKGKPTGRFTNGRTISDILDDTLGAKSYTPPYLAPSTQANITLGGINFASGGSGILDETGSLFIGRVPLRQQVDYFEECRNSEMVHVMGERGTVGFLKNAVFSLTIGSNDFLNYIQPPIPFFGDLNKVPPPKFQDLLVSSLKIQLQRLHQLGARKVVVVGVGPLGCIPFVRTLNLVPRGKCSAEVNRLIRGYNFKLRRMLELLNRELGPEAIFVYANAYDVVMGIVQHYTRYGFENADDPCCGGSFPPFICFKGNDKVNGSSVYCGDRSKYVFWDAYHPTEAANVIIADKLLNGSKNLSFPISILQLYNYPSK